MTVNLTRTNTLFGRYRPDGNAAKMASSLVTVLLGTMLIALCAKINVPVWPVPVTLQGFAVAALSAAFGLRVGVATVAAYLIEGALGLPVFAGATAGIPYLVGPTGGFLVGFLAMAAIIGFAADRGVSAKPLSLFAAMLVGDAALFALGFGWLILMAGQAGWVDQANVVGSAFAKAVQPFIVWDILKMGLASLTVAGLWSMVSKR